MYLEQFQLPGIPTVQPYFMSSFWHYWYEKTRYGLIDDPHSLFIYQIDYFGDLFVLEWSEFKSENALEWTKFEVEGDKFEVS